MIRDLFPDYPKSLKGQLEAWGWSILIFAFMLAGVCFVLYL